MFEFGKMIACEISFLLWIIFSLLQSLLIEIKVLPLQLDLRNKGFLHAL